MGKIARTLASQASGIIGVVRGMHLTKNIVEAQKEISGWKASLVKAGRPRFVLLRDIGDVFFSETVTEKAVDTTLESLRAR